MKAHISKFTVLIFVLTLFVTTAIQAQETSATKTEKEFVVSETVLKTYIGTYSFDQGIGAEISLKEGKLYGTQAGSGQPPMHLFAVSKTRFKLKAMDAEIIFNSNDKGLVVSITFSVQGQEMEGVKD